MKRLLVVTTLLACSFALAEDCYTLAKKKDLLSESKDSMCIKIVADNKQEVNFYSIEDNGSKSLQGTFYFGFRKQTRCIGCNKDSLGVANPHSTFTEFDIKFDGKTTMNANKKEETGVVNVAGNHLFYNLISAQQ